MKTACFGFGFCALLTGCGGASNGDLFDTTRADRVVLDVRCASDSGCPTGFECEHEEEHGTSTSYCKSHGSGGASSSAASGSSACPPGFEREIEHGGTFCKPHGGEAGMNGGASASPDGSTASPTGECTRDEDCAAGLECEVETEHGVTTSFCKPHGGGKKKGRDR